MEEKQEKPKYYQLKEELKEDIIQGKIKPGDKLLSENQLTVKYGVSRHTVRKALSILLDEGYITTEHGRGSFCADNILTKKHSKIIAVVTTYISNYIFPYVIKGIDSVLTSNGYSIILKNTRNSRSYELEALEDILKRNVDGIIIEPSKSQIYSRHLEIYNKFEAFKIPCVFIHSTYPQFQDKPAVLLDDEKGMYLITKYLTELGHKKLVGIFKTDDSQGLRRHAGFVKALNEAHLLYDPDRIIWYHTEDRKLKPRAELANMVQRRVEFDAVVCYNDQMAHEVISTLNDLNISVPKDVSVTGFDNSYETDSSAIGVTSIEHPKEQVGIMAAELLLELMNGDVGNQGNIQRVIEPKLVIKNSCQRRD